MPTKSFWAISRLGYTITVTSNGFTGTVNLGITNDPYVTAAATPTTLYLTSGASVNSTLGASASAPGTYTITVTATSGGLSHEATVTLRRR